MEGIIYVIHTASRWDFSCEIWKTSLKKGVLIKVTTRICPKKVEKIWKKKRKTKTKSQEPSYQKTWKIINGCTKLNLVLE